MEQTWIALAITDLIGLIGIAYGYWNIDKSLQGVAFGYMIFKIISYLAAAFIFGIAFL